MTIYRTAPPACAVCGLPATEDCSCPGCGRPLCMAHAGKEQPCAACARPCHICRAPAPERSCPLCRKPLCGAHAVHHDDICRACQHDLDRQARMLRPLLWVWMPLHVLLVAGALALCTGAAGMRCFCGS